MSIKKLIHNKNLLFISVLLLAAIILFSFTQIKAKGNTVRVSRDNIVIEEVPIDKDYYQEYSIGDEVNAVEIKDSKVKVLSANCDNQICVNTKEIDDVGKVIACLPHKFIVEIVEN